MDYTLAHLVGFNMLGVIAAPVVRLTSQHPTTLADAFLVFVLTEAAFGVVIGLLNRGALGSKLEAAADGGECDRRPVIGSSYGGRSPDGPGNSRRHPRHGPREQHNARFCVQARLRSTTGAYRSRRPCPRKRAEGRSYAATAVARTEASAATSAST